MVNGTRVIALMVLTTCASSLIAQSPSRPSTTPEETLSKTAAAFARRIELLTKQFDTIRTRPRTAAENAYFELCRHDCSTQQARSLRREVEAASDRERQLIDELAARIHREVDDFIAQAITPADLTEFVELSLRQVLGSASDGEAVVFASEHDRKRLAIVYTLGKARRHGTGATSVALRIYVERRGRFVLADSTGADLDGYIPESVKELPSPVPRESWFLLSGQLTGANGPNMRMRIYAFDGERFRTIWMPENAWGNFDIIVDDDGFTVKGHYYRGGPREDGYFLSEDGVYRRDRN